MPDVAFVIARAGSQGELAAAVAIELGRLGMPVSVHDTFPGPDRARLYVLADPAGWVRIHGEDALPADVMLRRTVALSAADPASVGELAGLYARVGRVFDTGPGAVAALRGAGVDARLLAPGYHKEWDRFDAAAPRPVEIVHMRDRPSAAELATAQIATVPAAGEWVAMLDVVRAMHAGAVVVAEHGAGLEPFVAGEHLFGASPRSLPHVVAELLDDADRLDQVRRAAHERLRDWLPFTASVAVMRAAMLDLLGRPLA